MRHRVKGRKLGKNWEHRKAMVRNLSRALIEREHIQTTEPKAKELRKLSDKLVSYGLEDTVHARRKAFQILEDRTLVKKLFDEIAPRFTDRPGGYTRIIKLAQRRKGDAAPMAVVEFTSKAQ
jgi:large subunit ribosomal protein L17